MPTFPQILQFFNIGVGTWDYFRATSFSTLLWTQRRRGRWYGACHQRICVKSKPGEICYWCLGAEGASSWENCCCQPSRYGISAIKSKVVFLKLYPLVVPFLLDLEYSCGFEWLHTWQFLTAERDLVWPEKLLPFVSSLAQLLGHSPGEESDPPQWLGTTHASTQQPFLTSLLQSSKERLFKSMTPVSLLDSRHGRVPGNRHYLWKNVSACWHYLGSSSVEEVENTGYVSMNSLTYWDTNRKILWSVNDLWNSWTWVLYYILSIAN